MLTKKWTRNQPERDMDLRLLRQTTLPVIAVGILLLAAGIIGAWQVHRLHKKGSDILSENVSSIRAAEELETVALEIRYRLKRFMVTQNERHLDEISSQVEAGTEWRELARKFAKTQREEQIVDRLDRSYEKLTSEFGSMLQQTDSAELLLSADYLADEIIPNRILKGTRNYIDLNELQLAQSREESRSAANQLMFGLVSLGTCGGVAGLIAGFVISRRVTRTIVQLALPLKDTAGKLDQVVGPISFSADLSFDDLESMLKTVSSQVTKVVERLQTQEREMLRAEQLAAVGQLAAGLAHELRNPLTSLKPILQLADAPSDLSERDLDVLKQEIARLEKAVQTFLDFARPPQLERRPVDLRQLVRESSELVSRQAERKRVTIHLHLDEPMAPVMGDANQLRQVTLNLLINALDAVSINNEIHVHVKADYGPGNLSDLAETMAKNRSGRKCAVGLIKVVDDGPGIPDEISGRIFDPFVSTKDSGMGLGLSICKRIIEAHSGQITVENCSGSGAEFTVRLPLFA